MFPSICHTLLSLGHSIASAIFILVTTSGAVQAPLMVVDHGPLVVCADEPVPVRVAVVNLSRERRVFYNFGGALPCARWNSEGHRVTIRKQFEWLESGHSRDVQFNNAGYVDFPTGQIRIETVNLAQLYPLKPGLYWYTVGHPTGKPDDLKPAAWPLPRPLLVVSCATGGLGRPHLK
jgi:hypothetical protein